MAVVDAYVFPGFLTPVLIQLFFSKPPTTFLTCFCRGERQEYAGKKSHLNRGSNRQPQGHESDMLTTEPPAGGFEIEELTNCFQKPSASRFLKFRIEWLMVNPSRNKPLFFAVQV